MITAIGVLSIVLGSLGIFGSGLGGLWTIIVATAVHTASFTMPPMSPAPMVVQQNVLDSTGDHGMELARRQIVLDGLTQVRPLTDQRRRLVDQLLQEDGKEIVLLPGDSLTAGRVAANVSDSGRLITSTGGDNGPDFFVVGTGRMEVADDHATFFASDGSPPVRVTADSLPGAGEGKVASGLNQRQIQGVFQRIKMFGGQLTPAQIQTLTQTLNNPGEQLVVPMGNGIDPATEITSAQMLADGSVMITSMHGGSYSMLNLSSSGQVTSSMTSTANTTNFATSRTSIRKISWSVSITAVAAAVASVGLAIYLLICGIMVLRQSPRGRKMHWIYVAFKIPLEIFSGLAMGWFFSEFTSNVSGGSAQSLGFSIISMVWILMGCVYPIALIFVLSSRTVREYYADIVAAGHF